MILGCNKQNKNKSTYSIFYRRHIHMSYIHTGGTQELHTLQKDKK